METARVPSAPASPAINPQVLIRFRGEGVIELHFTEPLTPMYLREPSPASHDYRSGAATQVTQPGTHVAYQLFWSLNDVTGLEVAEAKYRKVTLVFGLVFLESFPLRERIKEELETAIKQFAGEDIHVIWS